MFVTIQEAHNAQSPRSRPGDKAPDYSSALEEKLRKRTSAEVRFDSGSRALYAHDGSNYRQTPIGVVIPKSVEDVIETVATCREFGAPILARGGGTSLAGQCCNIAVVLDFSKYLNRILWLDPNRRQASIEPGIVLDELRKAAEKHHLTFGPDPATHTHCTLGGMIGNNSCGVHALMAGKTSENIDELDILLYDGTRMKVGATTGDELESIIREGGRRGGIYSRLKAVRDKYADLIRSRFPNIPRRVSGYNLDKLLPENGFHVAQALVGTECTCVTVLGATTRLVHSPPFRTLVVLGFPDVFIAGDHIPDILAYKPIGLEGLDDILIQSMRDKGLQPNSVKLLPDGRGWLMAEFGGETKDEANQQAHRLMDAMSKRSQAPHMRLFDDDKQAKLIWTIRESALGATAFVPGEPEAWEGWEDSAVRPDKVGAYLRDLRALYDRYGYKGSLYGHFGEGCIHTRVNFDFLTAEGIAKYRRYVYDAADLVLQYGGSFSGEHGDGQARAELLPKMFGPELMQAFHEFKAIWDPDNKMNPHKVIDPYKFDENLRLGTDYRPPQVLTHFQFPDDNGDFSHAALRCVGVGACRRHEGGTMCPSYMATREEQDSTRGRTHLLFEMMQGQTIKEGWKSEAVKESLDLCLSCKGCKGDCPVHVDVATYKAEFLAHYYEGRIRPRHAYAIGWIPWAARVASLAPSVANFFTQTPLLRDLAKLAAGIDSRRTIPPFATRTFKNWFARRRRRNQGAEQVILWPDTFSNYFQPEHAIAAVEVLENFGYWVRVPRRALCCGRPLYDYGMLDTAKCLLLEILDTLRPAIRKGMPLVGLEPSCLAVFRDELRNLFPHDEDALRLREQSFTLAEFLDHRNLLPQLPKLKKKAIVHGHCHHKAIMRFDSDEKALNALGLDFEILDSGCCGMAGGFGFEHDHYEVSQQIGERVLLPAMRNADADTLLLADGFSCQTQVFQATGRKPLHLAQAAQMAIRLQKGEQVRLESWRKPAAIAAAGALTGGALWWMLSREERYSAGDR